MKNSQRQKSLIAGFVFAAVTALDGMGISSASEPLRFYDGGWENIQVNNAIAMYILEKGYGVETTNIPSDVPDMQKQMQAGTIDINMEMWRSLMMPWVTSQVKKGVITNLGPTYERADQGFFVPAYVIKGDAARGIKPIAPDLKSIKDLKKYASQFKISDDKAGWLNCIPGWACREPNRVKMTTYGLDNHFTPVELGSEAELNERILRYYENGQPFVTYYWDPSPMLGRIQMVRLSEPEYTAECGQDIEKAVADYKAGNKSAQACAYETVSINKFVTKTVLDNHPQVVELLQNMVVGTDRVRELAGYMVLNGKTPDETAIYYLKNYPEEWTAWMPKNNRNRLLKSLN